MYGQHLFKKFHMLIRDMSGNVKQDSRESIFGKRLCWFIRVVRNSSGKSFAALRKLPKAFEMHQQQQQNQDGVNSHFEDGFYFSL